MANGPSGTQIILIAVLALVLIGGLVAVAISVRQEEKPIFDPRDLVADDNKDEIGRDIVNLAIKWDGLMAGYVRRFKSQMLRYPVTLDELVTRPDNLGPDEKWSGPYTSTEEVLNDPWGNRYQISLTSEGQEGIFMLWSMGPDGLPQTADDIGR
jgi:hypothetical protein